MSKISFARDAAALTRGMRSVVVFAPATVFAKARLGAVIGKADAKLLTALAADTPPGDLGASAGTLADDGHRRLVACVLPDEVSRYNSAARAESIRRLAAGAGIGAKGGTAVLLVLDAADHLLAAANAVAKATPLYSAKTAGAERGPIRILAVSRSGNVIAADGVVRRTFENTREAARLVDTPPTEMNPARMVSEARALLRGAPHVTVRVIAGKKLLDQGLGGIHAVGRAALVEPRMLVASFAPPRTKGPHIALVGKGITYDTGGLHIKMRGFMESMKGDMGGAAAVLGAFNVLARTGAKQRVTLILCLAENAIGPDAYKPDDILTLHSGKTVEINNTDAEGRVVLADGVSYAARKLKVDTILDAATLTGAQLVATGAVHATVVSNDAAVERALVAAGRASGDLSHAMMFAPELYRQEFKSPVADMRNSVKNRMNAQASCAAEFIHWHIADTGVPWGHVDMAGPSWRDDRGTGYGVALLSEAVRRLAESP